GGSLRGGPARADFRSGAKRATDKGISLEDLWSAPASGYHQLCRLSHHQIGPEPAWKHRPDVSWQPGLERDLGRLLRHCRCRLLSRPAGGQGGHGHRADRVGVRLNCSVVPTRALVAGGMLVGARLSEQLLMLEEGALGGVELA